MKRTRKRLKFSLATLLLLCIPVSVGAIYYRRHLERQPIQWETFSQVRMEKHLANGKPVLIFVTADWDVATSLARNHMLVDERARNAIHSKALLKMEIDIGKAQGQGIGPLVGYRQYHGATFVVLSPENTAPRIQRVDGLMDPDHFVEFIAGQRTGF